MLSRAVAAPTGLHRASVTNGLGCRVATAPRVHQQPQLACQRPSLACQAVGDAGDELDYQAAAARLNALLVKPRITATELRQLVFDKWGRSYDVRLFKREKKIYLQVMWKFLEQQSFPLTEEEYMQQLDAVCEYLTEWGVADTVRQGIANARQRGPGYTGGTSARCISIPLDVDLSGARSGEWD